MPDDARMPSSSLAGTAATPQQSRNALLVSLGFAAVTAGFAPFGGLAWPNIPAFVPIYQAITATCYVIAAWVLLADFRESGRRSLLALAGGTLYTALILLAQLVSVPGMVGPERLIGGSQTTIWLWTFWHLGPPLYGLIYAALEGRPETIAVPIDRRPRAARVTHAIVIIVFLAVLAVVTLAHDLLPLQNEGKDFRLLTSTGTAPAVTLLTILAAAVVWWVTRGRTVLHLWLAVSLVALVFDNAITMIGGARDSVGWYIGRLEALASASVLLFVYLNEIASISRRMAASAAALAAANERLRAETEQRLKAEEAMRQGQKLEAIGHLTAGVAHDFNNLLAAISGNVELAKLRVADSTASAYLASALRSTRRGARLTSQLLAFGRKQTLNSKPTDLSRLIEGMGDLLPQTVGRRTVIELKLADDLWPVFLDAGQFEMALINLAVNARDAMPEGGRLTIETRNVPSGSSLLPRDTAPGDHVLVHISDSGMGMSEEVVRRAFEPFFTTKEVGKGSGLGLSMVYGFVKQSGGSTALTSAFGKGTEIRLFLPRSRAGVSAAPLHRVPPELRDTAAMPARILVVDDDDDVREVAVGSLRRLGYLVTDVSDPEAAVELLHAGLAVDLVLVDFAMPNLDGLRLIERARVAQPNLPCMLITGYADQLQIDQRRPANVPVLRKPFQISELGSAIEGMLHGAASTGAGARESARLAG